MDMRAGQYRRLSAKELMLLNCGVGEDSRLALQGDQISQSRISTRRTDAEAEAEYFSHQIMKSRLIGKDPDAGKTESRRRRG